MWGILNAVFRGWIIKTFWAWFLVTLFPQLPALSVAAALGLSYCVSIMTPYKSMTATEWEEAKENHKYESDSKSLGLVNKGVHSFVLVMCLFGGWIIHRFFM